MLAKNIDTTTYKVCIQVPSCRSFLSVILLPFMLSHMPERTNRSSSETKASIFFFFLKHPAAFYYYEMFNIANSIMRREPCSQRPNKKMHNA